MRIAVLGAGAMGALYGGKLYETGQDVILIDIWQEHIETINRRGLRIDEGDQSRRISVPAKTAEEEKDPVDLILIFTKTFHTEQALQSVQHLIARGTLVLSLQNGLGNVERIRQYIRREQIILGMTNFPSDLIQPGHIKSTGVGDTWMMPLSQQMTPKVEEIHTAFNQAGLNCKLTDDIYPYIWEKAAFNSALNTLAAITGLTVGRLGTIPECRQLAFQVADEVLAVAEKNGVAVDRDRVKEMMAEAFVKHYNHLPSMLQDIQAGKKTEIDAINGVVIREAADTDHPVPATEILYKLVKVIEQI